MQEQVNSDMLQAFFRAVREDARLSIPHLSLYFVLYYQFVKNGSQNPISVNRRVIMDFCKIRSTATYHKTVKDLHNFGYINYCPSYHPAIGSHIFLYFSNP